MKTDETWVAEQARLLDLEEGFGPGYVPAATGVPAAAEPETAAPPA